MANGLNITDAAVRVFQCPKCNETINTALQECSFCSAIEAGAAGAAADALARINQACSDASYLKITAGTMLTFFGLQFVPLASYFAGWGYLFLVFAVPAMAIRWWLRFRDITTDDAGFRGARQTVFRVGIAASLFLMMFFVLSLL